MGLIIDFQHLSGKVLFTQRSQVDHIKRAWLYKR